MLSLVEEAVVESFTAHRIDRQAIRDRVARLGSEERDELRRVSLESFAATQELLDVIGHLAATDAAGLAATDPEDLTRPSSFMALGQLRALLLLVLIARADPHQLDAVDAVLHLHSRADLNILAVVGDLFVDAIGLVLLALGEDGERS